jgi:hypothetical protein
MSIRANQRIQADYDWEQQQITWQKVKVEFKHFPYIWQPISQCDTHGTLINLELHSSKSAATSGRNGI